MGIWCLSSVCHPLGTESAKEKLPKAAEANHWGLNPGNSVLGGVSTGVLLRRQAHAWMVSCVTGCWTNSCLFQWAFTWPPVLDQAMPGGVGSRGSGLSRGWRDRILLNRFEGAQSRMAPRLSGRSPLPAPLFPVASQPLSLLGQMRRFVLSNFFSKFH